MKVLFQALFVAGILSSSSFADHDSVCKAPADLSEALWPNGEIDLQKMLQTAGQAVGFYSKGKLQNADNVGQSDTALLKLFAPRNRGWGSTFLTTTLRQVALTIKMSFPDGERLGVGDIAQQTGGFISGHASHQNGLDADLTYFKLNHREQDPNDLRGFDETFVKSGLLTANFDVDRNWNLIKALVSTGQIGRIFVDPVIKRTFCDYTSAFRDNSVIIETLRRLRPYDGHDNHLHVRFLCPAEDKGCVPQVEPPEGDGCSEVF